MTGRSPNATDSGTRKKTGRSAAVAPPDTTHSDTIAKTSNLSGPRFGLIVHHTDGVREWAYDRDSKIGHLDKALDAAGPAGWTVVGMKNDWAKIFPFGSK